jgi:ABC-type phosphate/phosphonate transport system substrate-binding protein
MPPAMASTRLSADAHEQLTRALVEMLTTARGQAILRQGGVRRFAPVTDRNYDDIRRMLRALQEAGVSELS